VAPGLLGVPIRIERYLYVRTVARVPATLGEFATRKPGICGQLQTKNPGHL
jgi:hypothetical protein